MIKNKIMTIKNKIMIIKNKMMIIKNKMMIIKCHQLYNRMHLVLYLQMIQMMIFIVYNLNQKMIQIKKYHIVIKN